MPTEITASQTAVLIEQMAEDVGWSQAKTSQAKSVANAVFRALNKTGNNDTIVVGDTEDQIWELETNMLARERTQSTINVYKSTWKRIANYILENLDVQPAPKPQTKRIGPDSLIGKKVERVDPDMYHEKYAVVFEDGTVAIFRGYTESMMFNDTWPAVTLEILGVEE